METLTKISMNSNNKPNLKILVSYHKPARLIKDNICIPIHCGRNNKIGNPLKDGFVSPKDFQWLQENCIGDDTGDNISEFNFKYCELTAHYWAWKNYEKLGNPDYIGFMHYRHIFVFSDKEEKEPRRFIPFLMDAEYNRYLDPKYLDLGNYDMYVPRWLTCYQFKIKPGRWEWSSCPPTQCKVKDKLIDGKGDLEALAYIKKNYPEFYQNALEYYQKKENFQWNMFIFTKKIFFEYAQFLFNILRYVDQKIDQPHFCGAHRRSLAYLAEAITGIFIYQKIKEEYKVKYLPVLHIEDTSLPIEISPAFSKESVTICCSADNQNSYMCEVMIQSVIAHASSGRNYDLVVLYDVLSEARQKKILQLQEKRRNISIRFYRVNRLLGRKKFFLPRGYSLTALISLCVPEVFKNYEKVLYLEHDTVVKTDVSELYDTNLGKNWIAVCQDDVISSWLNSGREKFSYYSNQLDLKDPYNEYVSNAVILWNIQAIRESGRASEALNIIEEKSYRNPARDGLNKLCYGHVLFLDPLWNVCDAWSDVCYLPAVSYQKWSQNIDNAKIISFRATVSKPWNNTSLLSAPIWWRYARQTPVYEELLTINAKACALNNSMIREIFQLPTYKRKLKQLRWKMFFAWGKRKQRYRAREEQLEKAIKTVEHFFSRK